jgi:hypothetical protein
MACASALELAMRGVAIARTVRIIIVVAIASG